MDICIVNTKSGKINLIWMFSFLAKSIQGKLLPFLVLFSYNILLKFNLFGENSPSRLGSPQFRLDSGWFFGAEALASLPAPKTHQIWSPNGVAKCGAQFGAQIWGTNLGPNLDPKLDPNLDPNWDPHFVFMSFGGCKLLWETDMKTKLKQ